MKEQSLHANAVPPGATRREARGRHWRSLLFIGAFSLGSAALALAAETEVSWQPVTDYSISFPGDRPNSAPPINPFENFTHLGTDFGWMGPGQARIDAHSGSIRTKAEGEWTGTWHSLAGLALEEGRMFDPDDVLGFGGPEADRARVIAVTVDVRGSGQLRVELADSAKVVRWAKPITLVPGERSRHRFEIKPGELGLLKYVNWVAEPGCAAEVSSVGFEVERRKMSPEEWLFRISLGKLRRCHDPASGLTRDRAHTPAGVFDSISSSGLHALATAAAAQEGILDREAAAAEIRRTAQAMLGMQKAAGFLPHFARRGPDGRAEVHPGTEYSTIDTSIAFHALRLASDILDLQDVSGAVAQAVADLNFDQVTDSEGWIGHGFTQDGTTPLAGKWRDWGGETALVLTLEAMVPGREPRGHMQTGGRVFRGAAFIAEIQSLFYPDFDSTVPDLMTGTVWPAARRDLYERQARYVVDQWPDSAAARLGLFGLSGGEAGMPGAGYTASGADLPGFRWLHPHAMVMELAMTGRADLATGIKNLDRGGLLFPYGLPENMEVGLVLHNPMQGSLNAGFEAISAYHGWKRGDNDVIDEASRHDPMLRTGIRRFWAD
ncbi:hypothetical protein [Haloferula sp. BvORR071]|uniref:hypothetical protein n=1 Tax=Haloferula sp. BvORR071 TaxID=1396141 RepID=UPI000554E1ED|nr:hypothetical protein [Haloferula sp. BvORR071]